MPKSYLLSVEVTVRDEKKFITAMKRAGFKPGPKTETHLLARHMVDVAVEEYIIKWELGAVADVLMEDDGNA